MREILATAIIALSMQTATGFEANVSLDEALIARGELTIRDLAVGEVGLVAYPSFCKIAGELRAYGPLHLAETNELFPVIFRFKRLPGGPFSIEMKLNEGRNDTLEEWVVNLAINTAISPCEVPIEDTFNIETINGVSSMRDLLKATN